VVSRAIESASDEPVADDLHVLSVTGSNSNLFFNAVYRCPVVRYLKEHVWVKSQTESGNGSSLNRRLLEAELEHKRVDIDTRSLKLSQLEGDLVDRQEVTRELRKILAHIRSRLETQAAEHGMLFPEDIRADAIAEWSTANRLLCRELAATITDPVEHQ
jgi:hypothetical protein